VRSLNGKEKIVTSQLNLSSFDSKRSLDLKMRPKEYGLGYFNFSVSAPNLVKLAISVQERNWVFKIPDVMLHQLPA